MNQKDLMVMPADAESKKKNIVGTYPFLNFHGGCLNDSVAIAKFMADGHATFLGNSLEQAAKMDQWIYWAMTGHAVAQMRAIGAILGTMEVSQADYNTSMQAIKANAKILNDNL